MIAGDLLGERARLTPDALALVTVPGGERLSYSLLDSRTRARARWLVEDLRLGVGDRVGILAGNCVEFLETFFACGKVGTVLVPLGTRLTAGEIAHVVLDSGMKALVFAPEFEARVAEVANLVGEAVVMRRLESLPTDSQCQLVNVRLGPEDLWALLYTSGTTGKPKGVMIPHRQILWNGYNTTIAWGLRADDVSPIFTPLCHAGGLCAFLVPIVTVGGTVVLHKEFECGEVWRAIERERATVVLGVPTIWQRLAEAPEIATADLSSLRWAISGGAPLPRYLIDLYRDRGVILKQGFGMTEVGVNCFTMTTEEALAKAGSIGQPMPFTEVRLARGREDGVYEEITTPDDVGELHIRGPHVCRGYWNQPEATAAALDAEGWFHTGDLARRDAHGFYTIAGRAKDLFISGGVNVYPAEIEGELVLHPQVREAAVVGVPDEKWGEAGIAFVVCEGGMTPEALAEWLEGRLARYKHPKQYVFVTELPRTALGKVIKPTLREQWLGRANFQPLAP